MNVSIERLRFWLLAGAGLLVIVIVAFLGYAHYRAHRFLRDLPQKLGVDVRSETNNWTYSQSAEGRTIYTIHAAKAVQRVASACWRPIFRRVRGPPSPLPPQAAQVSAATRRLRDA